jgi:hypothetical protein
MIYGIIIFIILIIWYWNFIHNHPKFPKIKYSDLNPKTGDLVLFHGLDNMNAAFIGCYYTHIGIVYRESATSRPYIFEAWNQKHEILYPKEVSNGMAFVDLENRLNSYRGYVFYKPLAKPVSKQANLYLRDFINWAMNNMKYNPDVFRNGINKMLFNDPLRIGTNCGEIVYLSLIKLGLLNISKFKKNRRYHLRDMCYLINTDANNWYLPISYVWQNYFKP